MFKQVGMMAAALAASVGAAGTAGATSFVQVTLSGKATGTRYTQPLNGPGSSEQFDGRTTFVYTFAQDDPSLAMQSWFNGGIVSAGSTAFSDSGRAAGNVKGSIYASICTGQATSGCGTSQINDTWSGGALNLTGWIDTISTVTVTSPSKLGLIAYRLDSAVPEPATWATMVFGFALIGAIARHRRPRLRVANA